MATYVIEYETKEERENAIDIAEAKFHQMLRDEYDIGTNGKNVLTFDDSPDTSSPPIIPLTANEIRQGVLEDKARKDETMTVAELREMYKLRFLT